MSEGFVGQIFNSIQGEGLYIGKRQVFVRFAGCSGRCKYCDSEEFRRFRPRVCEVQVRPGSATFKLVKNPMTPQDVIRHIKHLRTPDTHSVSLTGGEPLLAGNFLADVARACKRKGLSTYLETCGIDSEAMAKVIPHVDIAAIDIKLPDHGTVERSKWLRLFEEELSCIRLASQRGVRTFVKIVALSSSSPKTVGRVCKRLMRVAQVPLVIQPVTPAGKVRSSPPMTHSYRLAQAAARAGVKDISIIPQLHKVLGVP